MVRNKNFETLSQHGVKALVVVLGTYIKQVISGNVADLIPWKYVLVPKSTRKNQQKAFSVMSLKWQPLLLYFWPLL